MSKTVRHHHYEIHVCEKKNQSASIHRHWTSHERLRPDALCPLDVEKLVLHLSRFENVLPGVFVQLLTADLLNDDSENVRAHPVFPLSTRLKSWRRVCETIAARGNTGNVTKRNIAGCFGIPCLIYVS